MGVRPQNCQDCEPAIEQGGTAGTMPDLSAGRLEDVTGFDEGDELGIEFMLLDDGTTNGGEDLVSGQFAATMIHLDHERQPLFSINLDRKCGYRPTGASSGRARRSVPRLVGNSSGLE